jgi:hypothetical protein
VRLHARRETLGSWKRVQSSSLAEGSVWYAAPPPREEAEVAANLTWKTEPPLAMKLDSGLGPAKSNVVIVQVR